MFLKDHVLPMGHSATLVHLQTPLTLQTRRRGRIKPEASLS
jgi:hypothetical protein